MVSKGILAKAPIRIAVYFLSITKIYPLIRGPIFALVFTSTTLFNNEKVKRSKFQGTKLNLNK